MNKPFAITLDPGSSLANHTGSWRTERPVYVDRLPPCNNQCPAGEDIQGWLFHAESGNYEAAWRHLTTHNPFPAIMGRVCYHTCEGACNRGKLDAAVGINSVERFLGDEAIKQKWQFDRPAAESGKHVLVIGAGPSGMSAAYHLRRLGHQVTVVEAGPLVGGMMRYGIPKYRLPREVLDAEMQRIVNMGVRVVLDTKIENVLDTMKEGSYDAAFLAVGAHIGKRTAISDGEGPRVFDAISVLRGLENGEKIPLGRRIAVYGGGNTAIDVARTVRRLGAEPIIIYRRTQDKMPAHAFEIEEALQEGVTIKCLSTIKQTDPKGIVIEKVQADSRGSLHPTGEYETLEVDSVVLALGQNVDLGALKGVPDIELNDGVVKVDANMMTGHAGLFAGGDMVPTDRNVTVAVGHGKKAARNIDAWLRGTTYAAPEKHQIATFERLNTWYYSDAPKTVRPMLDVIRRQSTFDEVQGGLDETNALFEARRCLSCGNCFECDNCYGVCPDNAVIKLGPGKRFQFNYDYCKGCGLCVAECPCGAINMVPENI
ncbi:NAD(P)-binding protein [Propionivibrio dicarboxylicus]|uniref:2-oxoacid:acceptor oxidoreductase, delta subunit, pyruvate/2-ketoisovalerate family n=1 Tax=Propionivibrio dicarboxylicus TaxID=83767 RepID=A0A1G7WXU5_9RHOO|nr:NAD(P)-binding protein [Propionivibrio dicarboxylicus]SDG76777.1 2-oxoacid:acceptor oxidoreductase, delta subunit, pyruvate/2-ketoisovalerate family [Propionivibrio dicarboxylicus]